MGEIEYVAMKGWSKPNKELLLSAFGAMFKGNSLVQINNHKKIRCPYCGLGLLSNNFALLPSNDGKPVILHNDTFCILEHQIINNKIKWESGE